MVCFELDVDEDLLVVYFYKFKLLIIYIIEKNMVVVFYEVENMDNKWIYFFIGVYLVFNLLLIDGMIFEDYYLDFGIEENLEIFCLEGLYCSGEIKKVVDKLV